MEETMRLEQLLLRAFGGGDVADAPVPLEGDDWWPQSDPAPGASEALELFRSELTGSGNDLSWLVFLGGPGNGKSELARRVVAWDEISFADAAEGLPGQLHRRSYDLECVGGGQVRLVNDATIRTDERSLVNDFNEALEAGLHLVANVNRGVLVEDLTRSDPTNSLSDNLLHLLLDPASPPLGTGSWPDSFAFEPTGTATSDMDTGIGANRDSYITQLSVRQDDRLIRIRVVKLDACSLFEPRPECSPLQEETPTGRWLNPEVYRVQRLRERPLEGGSPAEQLLEIVRNSLLPIDGSLDGDCSPISSNLQSLDSTQVRWGISRVMRAAELIGGRPFTYREIWGAISLLALGPMDTDGSGLSDVKRLIERYRNASPSDDAEAIGRRVEILLKLSRFRFTQALFSEPPPNAKGKLLRDSPATPVTLRMEPADPARDAIHGFSTDLSAGWATPVLDALEGALFQGSAINRLESRCPELVRSVVAPFDRLLESQLLAWCQTDSISHTEQDALMSWYGRYLMRLYAIAAGIPAFGLDLDHWTDSWVMARDTQELSEYLSNRVRMLLVPPLGSADGNADWFVLPAFSPRAEPILDGTEDPRVVARFQPSNLDFSATTRGDHLILTMRHERKTILEIELDYPLLREAMVGEGRFAGRTELGGRSTPRLERARAALLAGGNANGSWAVISGEQVKPLVLTSPDSGDRP